MGTDSDSKESLDAPEPLDLPADAISTAATATDGRMAIDVGLLDGGVPAYRITRDGRDIVAASPIGLLTSSGSLLDDMTIEVVGQKQAWSDEFDVPTGKQRVAALEGVSRTIRFATDESPLDLEIEVVVTDHAVAIRSIVTDSNEATSNSHVTIEYERFGLSLAPDATAWLQPHDEATAYRPAYEQLRSAGRPVEQSIRSSEGWTFPALVEHDGIWTLITEAGLGRGWAGSHLASTTSGGEFFLAIPSQAEGNGVGASMPSGPIPLVSPWRVFVVSDDLADIVETNIVRHLSPAGDPTRDFSWVEPGKVSWSWWSSPDSPKNADRLIDFIDLSDSLGWKYSLVDANWNELGDADFQRVVDAADTADVGLFLWYNSGGPHNTVTEAPRGRMTSRAQRRAEMERISNLGIRGVKVDFFHSDKPASIDLYLDILEDAADFELMVNFHGSTVPRGWSRTWPNLMTTEAVPGAEQYIFNPAYAAVAPSHNVLLAFTRNVVGSMDYTPTMLGDTRIRRTTNAHELALAVLYESGLTHLVDTPEAYLAEPDEVQSILRDLPAAWDETHFLAGDPESTVAIARRHGDEWWVGAINGTGEPVSLDVSAELAALGTETVRICDGETSRDYTIGSADNGALQLAAFGGCVIRLR